MAVSPNGRAEVDGAAVLVGARSRGQVGRCQQLLVLGREMDTLNAALVAAERPQRVVVLDALVVQSQEDGGVSSHRLRLLRGNDSETMATVRADLRL